MPASKHPTSSAHAHTHGHPSHQASLPATTWTLEQISQQLGISPQALARLCVRFRLPAQAYDRHTTTNGYTLTSALPSLDNVDNCFTEADLQALHHIHRRILGGESLDVIARDWFRHQKLSSQSALPRGSTFAQVLNQQIPELPLRANPNPATPSLATPPTPNPPAPKPPTPKVFQQLAQQLHPTTPVSPSQPARSTLPDAVADVLPQPMRSNSSPSPQSVSAKSQRHYEGLSALFSPGYSPAIGLAKLPDLTDDAVFRKTKRWPAQQSGSAAHTTPQHALSAQPKGLTKAFLSAIRNTPTD